MRLPIRRTHLALCPIALVALGCGAATKPTTLEPATTEMAKERIGAVLDAWHDAASASDEGAYFSHFTDDAIFLGTDATERWSVPEFREFAHPFFERFKAWSFHATRRTIYISDSEALAWFEEDLETENLGPARGSGVLRRVGSQWKIAHYNLALTIPNDRFRDVRSVLEGALTIPVSLQSIDLCTYAAQHGTRGLMASLRPSCGERSLRCEARLDGSELVLDLRLEEGEPSSCEEPRAVQVACPFPAEHEDNGERGRYPTAVSQLPHNAQVPVRIGDRIVFTLSTDRRGVVASGACAEPFPATPL